MAIDVASCSWQSDKIIVAIVVYEWKGWVWYWSDDETWQSLGHRGIQGLYPTFQTAVARAMMAGASQIKWVQTSRDPE
jgi:hypothetical protein